MKVRDVLEHFLSRAEWVDRRGTVDRVIVGDPDGVKACGERPTVLAPFAVEGGPVLVEPVGVDLDDEPLKAIEGVALAAAELGERRVELRHRQAMTGDDASEELLEL